MEKLPANFLRVQQPRVTTPSRCCRWSLSTMTKTPRQSLRRQYQPKFTKDLSPIRGILVRHSRCSESVDTLTGIFQGFKKAGTYITELNYTQLSEVGQTVMCGILVHNEGDILHGLGTEPASHLSLVFLVGIQEQRGDALNKIGCWLL
jgi:hypothetical protein